MSESYARLYYRFAQEFPAIYRDNNALATWVRLLVLADASWPLRPPLPRSEKAPQIAKLVECGLVILAGEDGYTVKGLDAERNRRSNAGRIGAAMRWHSDGKAGAMPRRDEQSKDEQGTRNSAVYDRMMKRRLEHLRTTGEWPEDWGPRPMVKAS